RGGSSAVKFRLGKIDGRVMFRVTQGVLVMRLSRWSSMCPYGISAIP
ncbi:hypothetical protein A2U01_0071987, partial [Trifolium medium]|nr:hypothetical protein [Trifolium medium]